MILETALCTPSSDPNPNLYHHHHLQRDKRSKFPPWIQQFVRESFLNLSTDLAVEKMRSFLRVMGQPIDKESLHSILMDEGQVKALGKQAQADAGDQNHLFVPHDHVLVPALSKAPLPRDSRAAPVATPPSVPVPMDIE